MSAATQEMGPVIVNVSAGFLGRGAGLVPRSKMPEGSYWDQFQITHKKICLFDGKKEGMNTIKQECEGCNTLVHSSQTHTQTFDLLIRLVRENKVNMATWADEDNPVTILRNNGTTTLQPLTSWYHWLIESGFVWSDYTIHKKVSATMVWSRRIRLLYQWLVTPSFNQHCTVILIKGDLMSWQSWFATCWPRPQPSTWDGHACHSLCCKAA